MPKTKAPLYNLPGHSPRASQTVARVLTLAGLAVTLLTSYLTQLAAARLGYSPLLGEPLLSSPELPSTLLLVMSVLAGSLGLFGLAFPATRPLAIAPLGGSYLLFLLASGPVYQPFAVLSWRLTHRAHPAVIRLLAPYLQAAAVTVTAVAAIALLALLVRLPKLLSKPDVHGSARWATLPDLAASGVLPRNPSPTIPGPEGLFLGLFEQGGRRFQLYDNHPHHLMLVAPTRSGKGVGIVIPNLLNYRHSAVVLDVKRELYLATSGYRGRELGHKIFLFDPTGPETSHFNPLCEVRLGVSEVRDAQNIADLIVDPEGATQTRSHWQLTAHELITATILHLLYSPGSDRTLSGCVQFLANPQRPIDHTLKEMLTAHHLPSGSHPLISSTARSMLDKASEELSGVVSTALSYLSLYRDPLVAAATATSDFRILDLVQHEEPITLYIAVPPSDLTRTRPLLRLMLNQLCRQLTETLDPRRREILFVLDEFPALRRLLFFVDSLAYLAGYGCRALIVTQDLSQLHASYGRDESISSNCPIRIAFTPNRLETAQALSNMLGTITVHHSHRTRRSGGRLFEASTTPTEVKRPLLTPDEVLCLPGDDALIFLSGQPPIRATRARYYEDPELLRRSRLWPARLSAPLP
jgi:type IV secretion system protein VirD4